MSIDDTKRFLKNGLLKKTLESLEYTREKGKLLYQYVKYVPVKTKFHSQILEVYKSSGGVPQSIIVSGDDAVKKYVKKRIKKDITKQKIERKKRKTFEKNPNFSIETAYDGKLLKGKIFNIEDNALKVHLEEPFNGKDFVIYGFASAMAKHFILNEKGDFTENAIKNAKNLLIRIYNEQKNHKKNKKVVDLVKNLNNE